MKLGDSCNSRGSEATGQRSNRALENQERILIPPCPWDHASMQIFPKLYLPVMEEANKRVLLPYRRFLPTPEWFQFRSRMAQLNTFLINFFRERWQARCKGIKRDRKDILDRILDSIEVCYGGGRSNGGRRGRNSGNRIHFCERVGV